MQNEIQKDNARNMKGMLRNIKIEFVLTYVQFDVQKTREDMKLKKIIA